MNPAPDSQVIHPNGIGRRVLCVHYDDCLDVALEKKWSGFTCSRCQDFEFEHEQDVDYWNDQAERCRDLLQCADYFPRWLVDQARRKLNELKNSACDLPEPV